MFSINVGDQIKLMKPMGIFRAVGTVCNVDRVEDNTIWFSCGFSNGGGNGCISMNEFHEYFEKVEDADSDCSSCSRCESCNGDGFAVDDVIELVRDCDDLPFTVGERFVVQNVGYGAVTLADLDDTVSWTVSNDLLTDYFEVVRDEDEDDDDECIELPDRVDQERVNQVLAQSKFEFFKVFDQCVIAACKLPNGMMLCTSYGFRSPEEYDFKTAKNECMNQFAGQVWNLETYALLTCHYNCAE